MAPSLSFPICKTGIILVSLPRGKHCQLLGLIITMILQRRKREAPSGKLTCSLPLLNARATRSDLVLRVWPACGSAGCGRGYANQQGISPWQVPGTLQRAAVAEELVANPGLNNYHILTPRAEAVLLPHERMHRVLRAQRGADRGWQRARDTVLWQKGSRSKAGSRRGLSFHPSSPTCCVALGKWLNLSKPQLPPLQRGIHTPSREECSGDRQVLRHNLKKWR